MKPSFALDFRDGVIALLHRTSRGWQQVGSTPVDAPDLGEALSYLRSTALGLSPRGLSTKLVIPNEQVLYTQVHAPGPEVAKRKRQIKAALEGLTPYKVDDLVYDWWGSGPEVHVAVVARETLAEAEAFAAEHRFNPVSFVAAPDSSGFSGEPFFGPSALSATLLAEGEKVERDQDPIALIAREYPRAEPAPEPASEPVALTPDAEPAPEAPVAALAEPAVIAEVVPDAPPLAEPVVPLTEVAPSVAVVPDTEPDPLPDFRAARAPAAGASSFDPKAMSDLIDEAPMAIDVADEVPEVAALPEPAVAASAPLPPQDDPVPARTGFASRRTPSPEASDAPVQPDPAPFVEDPKAAPLASGKASMTDFAAAAAAAKARKAPAVGPAPAQRPSVPRPALARPPASLPSATRETLAFPPKGAAAKVARPAVTAAGIAGPRRERNVVPLPKAAGAPIPQEGGKAGVTGLDGRPLPTRGKPRYLGLILTAILLLALALVAAWSSLYLSSNEPAPGDAPAPNALAAVTPDQVAPADATLEPAAPEVLPTVEDESLADGQDPALTAETVPEPPLPDAAVAAAPLPEVAAEPEAAATDTAPVAAAPLPEPAPQTTVVTDAAIAATPGDDPQDEIFLAAADTPPQTSDPLVLPQVFAGSDPPPEAAPPPPPFGTVYAFDAEGRIQPTPEGILTPEGVLLIAGAPKLVPPTRPAALVVAAPGPETPVTEAVVTEAAAPDPALAGKKPRSRPPELVEDAATAGQQGEALAPDPNSRFASLRPQQRPQALTQTVGTDAPDLTNGAGAASLAANGIQGSTSELAIVVSRKPAARPSGMEQAVDAAVAAAVQAPEPQEQVAGAAPEADAEPEAGSVVPRLPTNASVARQATTKNALNLSRVALLGIFTSSSGRYAMIRQPGGGVKKVVVGDKIDGGDIAAISATAVEYRKGGRMVTLSLPTG